MFIHAFFFRRLGDFSKKCFNLGRNAYARKKKFPKRYMLFTLKFQGEKHTYKKTMHYAIYVFWGLSHT